MSLKRNSETKSKRPFAHSALIASPGHKKAKRSVEFKKPEDAFDETNVAPDRKTVSGISVPCKFECVTSESLGPTNIRSASKHKTFNISDGDSAEDSTIKEVDPSKDEII